MEMGEIAHYDQKKGLVDPGCGSTEIREGSGHSHHMRTSTALGMTTQAYAITNATAQWLGWRLSQALGVVNSVVGRLAGKVPQALGG